MPELSHRWTLTRKTIFFVGAQTGAPPATVGAVLPTAHDTKNTRTPDVRRRLGTAPVGHVRRSRHNVGRKDWKITSRMPELRERRKFRRQTFFIHELVFFTLWTIASLHSRFDTVLPNMPISSCLLYTSHVQKSLHQISPTWL